MGFYAVLPELLKAHLKAEDHGRIYVLIRELAESLHTVKVACGLYIVRKVYYLFQQRHVRAAGRVPADGAVYAVRHAEEVPREGGAGYGVGEFDVLPLKFIEHYTIFLRQYQLLVHAEFFGDIVQNPGLCGVSGVLAPAPGQRGGLLLAARDVRDTAGLEIGIGPLAQPVQLRLCAVVAHPDYPGVYLAVEHVVDRKQSMNGCAKKRFENYKMQPLEFAFMPGFKGKLSQYGITPERRTPSGIRAAIIREKGTNGEREMAYSLYLAGFDVKDVTMTDLISGRETLEDVNMIVYCGGFSNSDVLGSAKGWAGGFLFNPKAKEALDKFYAREDTLSLGICNGCQLMMELGLVNPEHEKKGKMLHNESHKFESTFVGVTIPTNRSVMFGSLSGSKLGIWVAHGEGKFSLPYDEDQYNVVAKYSYDEYPGNPNGSDYSIAALASADGRHLAMMPHLERAIFPWQNACYPADRVHNDQVTPWIEAFVNARKWVEEKKK